MLLFLEQRKEIHLLFVYVFIKFKFLNKIKKHISKYNNSNMASQLSSK